MFCMYINTVIHAHVTVIFTNSLLCSTKIASIDISNSNTDSNIQKKLLATTIQIPDFKNYSIF